MYAVGTGQRGPLYNPKAKLGGLEVREAKGDKSGYIATRKHAALNRINE